MPSSKPALEGLIQGFQAQHGRSPSSWNELADYMLQGVVSILYENTKMEPTQISSYVQQRVKAALGYR